MVSNGINAFFSVSYIPFLIPGLLSIAGANTENAWLTCCIIIALATSIASYSCNRALIAGPSIAATAIITESIAPNTQMPEICAIILIVALLLIISAKINLHKKLLNVLSCKTKIGFKAGIGLMFIVTALAMTPASKAIEFVFLVTAFKLTSKKRPYIAPVICIVITLLTNHTHIATISTIQQDIVYPDWSKNLIPYIFMLYTALMIDCTITANTLNPGKEHKGLNLAGCFSILGAISGPLAANIYLETLIIPNKNQIKTSYICAICFLIAGFVGKDITIPNYLSASLLASLGISIFIASKPNIWLPKSPQISTVAAIIGLSKSFIIAITAGIAIDCLKTKPTKDKLVLLATLLAAYSFSHLY